MANAELAWAAGFFDGEGGTYTSGTNLELVLAQIEPLPLLRFAQAVGAGTINGPIPRKRPENDVYRYSVTGLSNIQFVLSQLWPWLGPVKRAQAVEAVRIWTCSPRKNFRYLGLRDTWPLWVER
jgi:hypothetical protein